MSALLRTVGLSVRYGGLTAVADADLTVEPGEVVGLIGPNGAGKTTLLDALTGYIPCTGRIEFRGDDISHLAPHRRARLGITRTFQSLELFDDLTVAENVAVALERPSPIGVVRDLIRPRSRRLDSGAGEALDLLNLGGVASRMPSELSHGQRRLAACARALAGRPSMICMDEPAAGLDTAESGELGRHLRAIATHGTAILLVEHDMSIVFDVCDRVYVIEFGRMIATDTPDAIRRDPAVVSAYLGRSTKQASR